MRPQQIVEPLVTNPALFFIFKSLFMEINQASFSHKVWDNVNEFLVLLRDNFTTEWVIFIILESDPDVIVLGVVPTSGRR